MSHFVSALIWLGLAAVCIPSNAGAYTVQAGDTPQGIAKKHNISVDELLKANKDLKPSKMHVGDSLNIPGASSGKAEKKPVEKETAKDKGSHKAEPVSAKERAAEARDREKEHKSAPTKGAAGYTVKKGDTLGSIAVKHGLGMDEIIKANKGLNPNSMKVGQEIVLPGSAPAAKAEPAEKSSRKAEKPEKAEKVREPQEPTSLYAAHKKDTPDSVARKFRISVKELARLNPDMGRKLHSGQKLVVPAGASRSKASPSEELPSLPSPEAEPEAAPERPVKAAPRAAEPADATPALPDSREAADAESFFEKGIEFGKQNKFPKAVESFDKAIKLNPNRADFYASRGHANYYMKQYPKAIDDYTKAIEKNPNFALAYSMRGLSRTRSGRYPQAIEDFNRAIALGPNEADFYKGRGFTYLHLKQPGPMCQDYKKACDLGDCELLESARKEKACP
jgi:LysM repeat protein